ncbi:hypothetical protein ACFZDK_54605 [Streptomyces sp. NPDC007901]|uniref:hypothetical protein n=1 Tax=Streptomyces sp. NPDC007901 TaxID=3364785 RepID=UPI0036E6F179
MTETRSIDSSSGADTVAGPELGRPSLTFRFGKAGAYIAPVVFIGGVIAFFTGYGTFDLTVLGVVGLMTLFVGSVFARSFSTFWERAIDGVASKNSATLLLLLLSISVVSAMIKASGISNGFVWLATELNLSGGAYVAVAFRSCASSPWQPAPRSAPCSRSSRSSTQQGWRSVRSRYC